MVECNYCKKEMTNTNSCTFNRIQINGEIYNRMGYHSDVKECPDCGTPVGGIHHLGCDGENCPSCLDQLIKCDCNKEAIIEDEGRRLIK